MYCAACGTPLSPGLSYCNRCGMSLKERSEPSSTTVNAYLTAITIIGVTGLGLMLGGAIALKNGAQFHEDLIAAFMLMTFAIVGIIEISLCRQLSRLNRASGRKDAVSPPLPSGVPTEIRGPLPRSLGDPVSSVTENTTRTLEYARHEPLSQEPK